MIRGKSFKLYKRKDIRDAKRNGIDYANFRNRVDNLGWDVEKAKTQEIKRGSIYGDDMIALAKKNGIQYNLFIVRVRDRGWNPIEAATTPAPRMGSWLIKNKTNKEES